MLSLLLELVACCVLRRVAQHKNLIKNKQESILLLEAFECFGGQTKLVVTRHVFQQVVTSYCMMMAGWWNFFQHNTQYG